MRPSAYRLQQPLFCIAHRGGKSQFTENTLENLSHCLTLGVDAIEIDVWHVGGELLVTHDRKLGVSLPGEGRLLDYSPTQLLELELECGSKLAHLNDVLELVGDKALLNIEIKGPECALPLVAQLTSHCSDNDLSFEQFVVSSFDHPQLNCLQQHLPEVKRGVLIAGIPMSYAACCDELGAYSFHPNINCMDQALVDDAKRRGLKVWVYTVNETDDMELLSKMGVDGVFTDYPATLIALNKLCTTQR